MSKRSAWIVGVVVVVIVVAGVVFGLTRNNSSSPTNNTTASQNSNTPSVNNAVVVTKTDPSLGQYLADPSGRALYTYNADTKGVSNCTGSCLTTWPAYTAKSSIANLPSNISTITRSDNHQVQYTYNGLPLYYFVSDSPGKITGNGVENFAVATPSTAAQSSTPSQSNSSSGYPY